MMFLDKMFIFHHFPTILKFGRYRRHKKNQNFVIIFFSHEIILEIYAFTIYLTNNIQKLVYMFTIYNIFSKIVLQNGGHFQFRCFVTSSPEFNYYDRIPWYWKHGYRCKNYFDMSHSFEDIVDWSRKITVIFKSNMATA